MQTRISTTLPIPLYIQLRELIRHRTEAEELRPGDPLPPERELAGRHGFSRLTVRQALLDLIREGLLERSCGRGTFVSTQKIQQVLGDLIGFVEDLEARGLHPKILVLGTQVVRGMSEVTASLGLARGARVRLIERLITIDSEPLLLDRVYLPVVSVAASFS